ncbi:MAG: RNA polymerase sigma factor [Oscillospiraceae bacterium]
MIDYCLMLLDDSDDAPLMCEMYELFHEKLLRYALSILKNPDDAEDIVQSTWERVARHFSTAKKLFNESCSVFLAWLVTIVKNLAIDELRRRGKTIPLPENWDEADAETTESQSEVRALRRTIRAMPEKNRAVMELRLIDECSFAEIGKALGLTEDAARMRYSRGLEILQETLRKEGVNRGKSRT